MRQCAERRVKANNVGVVLIVNEGTEHVVITTRLSGSLIIPLEVEHQWCSTQNMHKRELCERG